MPMDTRMRISRRGVLAAMAGIAGAAVARTLSRADHALATGDDGEAVAVGAHYDDVRSATTFGTTDPDTTVLSFSAVDGERYQHTVTVGPNGIRAGSSGHWSHRSVTIDGTVRATGGGSDAASVGPMIVGEGDTMGVYGAALADGPGVRGQGMIGVEGIGVTGVRASGDGGPGVSASGQRGGTFVGNVAQLQLQPSELPTHPALGEPGDLFVDASHRLWFCKGGAQWSQVA
jgi:hypothetical protein